jgi:exosortase A-associated hydrolase 2
MRPALDAFFSPAPDGGQRLYLHHTPPAGTTLRGGVLYLHPWTEEMNKSRRMAALASRALANDGWAVLQIDLLGCGDSSGDFGDATWDAWVDDAVRAAVWLRTWLLQRSDSGLDAPLWLWGLRAGALLACDAAAHIGSPLNLLFWQPLIQGKTQLHQFLRLKAAAALADGGGKAIIEAARADLAAGRPVEVAGYMLSATLARGLESATLSPPPTHGRSQASWLEVASHPVSAAGPAVQAAASRWQKAGWLVDLQSVPGPAFWQTTEIEEAPALLGTTLGALKRSAPIIGPTGAQPFAATPA